MRPAHLVGDNNDLGEFVHEYNHGQPECFERQRHEHGDDRQG